MGEVKGGKFCNVISTFPGEPRHCKFTRLRGCFVKAVLVDCNSRLIQQSKLMKKLIVRFILVLVVLLIVAVGVSIYFLGSIVKKGVETVGPQITKTEIKLDGATLSLLSGSGKLKGLFVGNPQGFKTPSAIKVGSVSVGVAPGSVLSDKVHVKEVRVEAPE